MGLRRPPLRGHVQVSKAGGAHPCPRPRARLPGGHSGRAPPGPIPNPEVKPPSADDSAAACRAKVGNRQAPHPGPRHTPWAFFVPASPQTAAQCSVSVIRGHHNEPNKPSLQIWMRTKDGNDGNVAGVYKKHARQQPNLGGILPTAKHQHNNLSCAVVGIPSSTNLGSSCTDPIVVDGASKKLLVKIILHLLKGHLLNCWFWYSWRGCLS